MALGRPPALPHPKPQIPRALRDSAPTGRRKTICAHRRSPRRSQSTPLRAPRPCASHPPSPTPTPTRNLDYASSTCFEHRRPDQQTTHWVARPYLPETHSAPRSLPPDAGDAAPSPGGGSKPVTEPGAAYDPARSSGTPCLPAAETLPSAPAHTARRNDGEYTDRSAAPRPRTARKRNSHVKRVSIGTSRAR